MSKLYHFVDRSGFLEAPPFPEGYELVAEVDTDDLEEVFWLTNNVDHYWGDNEKVKVFGDLKVRSTSINDIVEKSDGTFWICATCGWDELSVGSDCCDVECCKCGDERVFYGETFKKAKILAEINGWFLQNPNANYGDPDGWLCPTCTEIGMETILHENVPAELAQTKAFKQKFENRWHFKLTIENNRAANGSLGSGYTVSVRARENVDALRIIGMKAYVEGVVEGREQTIEIIRNYAQELKTGRNQPVPSQEQS